MSVKIAKALHEVMQECAYVQKTGHNKFHNYSYAGEADLLAVLRPAMIKAGLLMLPSVVECRPVDDHGNTTVIVEYTLVHKDGDVWPHPIRIAGTGNDKSSKGGIGDKGTYKALTGANKYLLFKLFQIETGDDPEHDDRKPGVMDRDPIGEARREIDPNGTAPSQYQVDKAAKVKAATPAEKRAKAEAWTSKSIAVIKDCRTAQQISDWWDGNSQTLDRLHDEFNDLYEKLDIAASERTKQVPAIMSAA